MDDIWMKLVIDTSTPDQDHSSRTLSGDVKDKITYWVDYEWSKGRMYIRGAGL